ncbi:MAG: single-stranded DNA-binding protein [Acidobacteriaceae bacterium]|nr:single-stranded DNA-binding protein [Acidobacteriaceae bacterium]
MKNIAIIEGRLGQNPTTSSHSGSDPVTTFSVAINRRWKTESGEQKEAVDWFQVKCWGRLAKPASNLQKGDTVAVSGPIRTSTYEKDGVERTAYSIQANHLRKIDFSIYGDKDAEIADEMVQDAHADQASPF